MDQETKELLLRHIKSGRYIGGLLLDILKIFNNAGMGLYAKACCHRIEAAGLVDGIHVFRAQETSWRLLVDIRGLGACREILGAYLQPEELKVAEETLRSYWSWSTSLNNIIYTLKKRKNRDLRECRADVLGYKAAPGDQDDVAEIVQAELKRRRPTNRICCMAKRFWLTCQLLALFRGPVSVLRPFTVLAWKSWEDNGDDFHVEGSGKYSKALQRFTDAHRGTNGVSKLGGDDLLRYIFLAVRAYGKENKTIYRHTGIKDCREVDCRYKELKRVMEAVGRLTSEELLRIFPVSKEYSGEKRDQKDYFFTMDKLRKRPANQPIGDAQDVACLLWDYQNWDLEFLLLQWMNVLGDLHIYCNDPGPDDEFHNKLLRRKGTEADGEK